MKRIIIICLIATVIAGCTSNKEMNKNEINEISPSKLPKVDAFQDEYTRQFMFSTKEVEQGYYLFESLTEKYTMHFPEGAVVIDSVISESNRSEIVTILYMFNVESLSHHGYELDFYLQQLGNGEEMLKKIPAYPDTDFDYNNEMEKVETDDLMIYHAQIERNLNNGGIRHHIIGVIESKRVPQMIYFDAKLGTYSEDERLSDEALEKASDELLELTKTVQFTKGNE